MKHHVRMEMKAKLAAISPGELAARSHAACTQALVLPEYLRAQAVMLYLPIPAEVDTAEIALHAWQAGKTVLAPKIDWEQRHLLAVEIHSLEDGLARGRFGIREPAAGEPCPVDQIDLIIVPALAYDRSGGRLGRGGGFYDRFLAEPGVRAVTCGLAFDEQLVDELPAHKHDRAVELLVTDKEVHRFGPTRLEPGRKESNP